MRKINIQNQLRLFMHSLKYNIYIIEIIHHTLDVIYIYLLNISYLFIYICILSQSVFSILPHVIYIILQIQYPCACFAHTWDILQSKRFLIPTLLLTYGHVWKYLGYWSTVHLCTYPSWWHPKRPPSWATPPPFCLTGQIMETRRVLPSELPLASGN